MRSIVSATSLATLSLVLATPALAQEVATAAQPAAAPAEVDGPATGEGLGDIVVTATKRETNLQSTPISMSVVNAQALKDRHIQSLLDFADGAVPGLRVATFEARQSALTIGIRGIVPLDANQPAREQGVGVYVDGVYLGRQHGLNAALFDVERVEVLKGPQGTLFGRNTEGGALSIVSRAPSGKFEGRTTAGMGNYGAYNSEIHLDLPEFKGFSFKIDGVIQHQNATTTNPLEGATGFNYYHRKGIRGAVRWKPTDTITNDFSVDVSRDANTPYYSQLLNYNPNGCRAGAQSASPGCFLPGTQFTNLSGTVQPVMPGVVVEGNKRMDRADIGVPQQPSVDKSHGFTNNLKWKVAPELEIRSITAWRGVNVSQWDNSGGAHRVPVVAPGCSTTGTACNFSRYSLANLNQTQFSQELQAVGSISRFDYVAGLYYFNEHVRDDAATPNSNKIVGYTTAGQTSGYHYEILDPCVGSGGFGSQTACRSTDRASQVRSRSYAAYGQVTWNATDAIHLTAGGRYTHDKKEGVLLMSRNINYIARPDLAARNGYQPLDKTWNRFNPMVTLAYDLNSDIHTYFKYSTGYRAGGASSRTSNYQAFNPEDVRSYEIGLKTDFWGRRGRFNIAGYIMDRDDSQVDISSIQTTATGNFNNLVTINAPGTTKIRGIEAELTLRPIERLTLNASYTYTYTKIPLVPITVGTGAAAYTTLQRFFIVFTPRNAASGSIDYAIPTPSISQDASLRFHIDGNYAQATQTFDQFATKADASFLVNARLSLADIGVGNGSSRVTASFWVRNLFDKQYVYRRDPSNSLPGAPTTATTTGSISNILGDYGNFNAPRTFGGEISVRF
jgi:iron complex outermembrane recepter protein